MVIYYFYLSEKTKQNYQNMKTEIFEQFDNNLFNFTKVDKGEIVCLVEYANDQTIINFNLQKKENDEFIHKYDFENKKDCTDIILRNIFPIASYHMLILVECYKLHSQYINANRFIFKILNFISACDDKNAM
jgi:hypothetical protein